MMPMVPDGATGLPVLLGHLGVTAAVLLFVAIAAALGCRLAPMPSRPLGSALLATVSATAIGFGAIATLLLGVVSVFGVHPVPVWAALIVAVLAALGATRSLLALLRESLHEWQRVANLPANLALVFVIAALWLGAAPSPVDFDSLMYHLRGPELYLQAGRLVAAEGNGHLAYVGAMHMLYLPFLMLGLSAAPALLQASFVALGLTATAVATDAWFRVRAGWIVVILALASPMLLRVGATAMIDAFAACLLMLAQWMLLAALRRPRDGQRFAMLAGVLLGIAVGTKILSAAYAVATAAVLLPLLWQRPRSRPRALRLATIAFIAALVAAAPWLLRTWALYGSPTYPYFAERSLPAWTASAPGAVVALEGTSALRNIREPFTLRAWFMAPETLTPEGDGYLFGASIAFALVLLIPLFPRRLRALAVVLPAVLFLGFVLGWSRFLNLRYLMPLLLPLTVGAAVVMAQATRRWLTARTAVVVASIAALAAAVSPSVDLVREISFGERQLAAVGAMSPQRYRSRHNEIEALASYLNTATPDTARVLFLFEARAFGIRRTVIQDNVMENWRLLRPAIARGSCLEKFGFTHVVLGRATLRYLVNRGWPAEREGLNEIDPFLARCSTGATGDARHGVFVLRGASITPSAP